MVNINTILNYLITHCLIKFNKTNIISDMKKYIQLFISGFISGLFIGLAGLAYILCNVYVPSFSVLGAFIFPFGLLLICILKTDLFTGKIGFAFDDKSLSTIRMIIMLFSNLLASLLFGLLSYFIFQENESVIEFITNLSKTKLDILNINSLRLIARSILCGILVYLAVYLFKKLESPFLKFISVMIPIFFFVLCGFDHCIANMFYFSFAMNFQWVTLLAIIIAIFGNSCGALLIHYSLKYIL